MCLHCILEGGEILVYFTRTPQKGKGGGERRRMKRRRRGGRGKRRVKLCFKVLGFFSVWLKAPFQWPLFKFYFSLWNREQKN